MADDGAAAERFATSVDARQEQARASELARLVERSQADDRQAFGQVYDRTFASVYRYALSRTQRHEDAEDVTAETFERALCLMGSYDPRAGSVTAWLIGIARNVAREHVRRRRQTASAYDADAERDRRMETGESTHVDVIVTAQLMALLTDGQREVLALRVSGFRVREVAEMVGKAEGTVKALQHAAMEKLRRARDGQA